jgi:hypothetical protein
MSDFLQAIADHLNAEPTMCACGHPSVLHTDRVGCMAAVDRAGSARCRCRWAGEPCPCDDCREDDPPVPLRPPAARGPLHGALGARLRERRVPVRGGGVMDHMIFEIALGFYVGVLAMHWLWRR